MIVTNPIIGIDAKRLPMPDIHSRDAEAWGRFLDQFGVTERPDVRDEVVTDAEIAELFEGACERTESGT